MCEGAGSGLGGPLAGRGEALGSGQDRAHSDGDQRGQPVAASARLTRVGQGGQDLEQMVMVWDGLDGETAGVGRWYVRE